MMVLARTREKPTAARPRRRRLLFTLNALAGFGLLAYVIFLVQNLQQIGDSVGRANQWAAGFAEPLPSATTTAAVEINEPALLPQPVSAQRQDVEYDRGGDPVGDAPGTLLSNTAGGVYLPPSTTGVSLEHMPAEPATRQAQFFGDNSAVFLAQLETLLADDPEALQTATDLLNEPNPAIRAENLLILRDAFGLE